MAKAPVARVLVRRRPDRYTITDVRSGWTKDFWFDDGPMGHVPTTIEVLNVADWLAKHGVRCSHIMANGRMIRESA